ncbi:MAG: FHA domain-containing protein [Anaerolineaceae bacterium]|nr:FHA domain-containing protein [Anaerolineaceae bacterium]
MMTDRLSSSFILLGGALAIIALWVLTGLAVNWDMRQRNITGSERKMWTTITIGLPLFGFALYLGFRVIRGYFTFPHHSTVNEETSRKTAVKPAHSEALLPKQSQQGNGQERFLQPAYGIEAAVRMNGKHKAPILSSPADSLLNEREPSASFFVLSVIAGPYYGQQYILQHFPVMIGRGSEADIPFDGDLNVSRKHAEIYEWGGSIHIRHLESTHGTKVNGMPVREKVLNLRDQIQIGTTVLLLGEMEQNWDARFSG